MINQKHKRALSLTVFFSLLFQPFFMIAHVALKDVSLDCVHHEPSIISSNEWEELELDWLVKHLDKTQTSMGKWAFKQMLHPVAQQEEIIRRQQLVRTLVENPRLFSRIKKCLSTIKKAESFTIEKMRLYDDVSGIETVYTIKGGLLSYWDNAQYRESDKLFAKIAQLYYSATFVPKKQYLNTHRVPLEISMVSEMVLTALKLLGHIGLEGFWEGFGLWMLADDSQGKQVDFDPVKSFMEGIARPWKDLYPFQSEIGRNYTTDGSGSQLAALFRGTLGDRFWAIAKHYNSRSRFNCYLLGRMFHKVPFFGRNFDNEGYFVNVHKANDYKRFSAGRLVSTYMTAAALSGLWSYYRLSDLYERTKALHRYWLVLIKSLRQLQTHLVNIASAINAIRELDAILYSNEMLRSSCIAQHFDKTFRNPSEGFERFYEVLRSSTFSSKANSIFYSRGRTLLAHKLFEQTKHELIPALRGIGELDAVCAIAQNFKDRVNTDKPLTFVEFINSSQAVIAFENSWIPVLNNAVPNSIYFGGDHPTKLVITGPNGGGKSTVLKALGHSVVLAQSWGIVPATKAKMTIFNALRTCLHPHESLHEGLSTFMAEKARVDEINAFVHQNRAPGFKLMVLLDEPFKGTVDAESARRIYDFGIQIAPLPESIVCIATHVKKPIFLAEDTHGAFSNRHVVITPIRSGGYKREFRLDDGPAWWWFEDKERRSQFINWLGEETIKVKQQGYNA